MSSIYSSQQTTTPEQVCKELAAALKEETRLVEQTSQNEATLLPRLEPLRVVSLPEFLNLDIAPREYILDPILPKQGLGMITAYRGVGKTFFTLSLAIAISCGGSICGWRTPCPRRVLFCDGEMPAAAMKERLQSLQAGADFSLSPENLQILTPDLQSDPMPNLSTPAGQRRLEPLLKGVEVLILDNLSTLAAHGRDNDVESWRPMQAWLLDLRRRGLTVIIVHHAGKDGAQRGTSGREDILDLSLLLKRPSDYENKEGARFEVHFTKARALTGEAAEPFEAKLETTDTGLTWTVRPLENVNIDRIRELVSENVPLREIASELGLTYSKVQRLCRKHEITTVRPGRRNF